MRMLNSCWPQTAAALVTALLTGSAASAGGPPILLNMGALPDSTYSQGFAVTPDGITVVGYGDTGGVVRALRWTMAGGLEPLPALPGRPFGQAYGVSADGSVIVGIGYADSVNPNTVACVWAAGGVAEVGAGSGESAKYAFAVSQDGGAICGERDNRAYLWTDAGGFELIPTPPGLISDGPIDISGDASFLVGTAIKPGSYATAYRWSQGAGFEALGGLTIGGNSSATAISADGSAIAGGANIVNDARAIRWTESDGMQNLGTLPGATWSHAYAISGDGQVVGGESGDGANRAFIWSPSLGMVSLRAHLHAWHVDLTGWTFGRVQGISHDGSVMTGYGEYFGQVRGWIALNVPTTNTPPPPPCADVSGDGVVNFVDISSVLTFWGTANPFGDADGNGIVDFADINAILAQWLNEC